MPRMRSSGKKGESMLTDGQILNNLERHQTKPKFPLASISVLCRDSWQIN
jgi:hypothetical protein